MGLTARCWRVPPRGRGRGRRSRSRCVAHSDGDVLLHCVTDAVLGALCLEDIGQIFPDNDPKWKGAASDIFMNEAMRLCDEMGYRVSNLDATIIAQRPKLSPLVVVPGKRA